MTNGDTFLKLHNDVVGPLVSASAALALLCLHNALNETDDKQAVDTIALLDPLIDGFEEMSQRYLLEEN
jgi:hypothetical protein